MIEKKFYISLYKKNTMSKEAQKEYIRLAQEGNKEAEEILIKDNLGLIIYVINKYFSNTDIDKDDLFQVGCIGLLKAIKRFDISLKLVLSTYAVPSIWGEIKRYTDMNNSILKVPDTIRKLLIKIIRLKNDNNMDNDLTISNMSQILNADELDIILALHSNRKIKSISDPIKVNTETEGKLEDLIPSNDPLIEEVIIKAEVKDMLYNLIEKLDIREQIVIRYTYGINCIEKTQKEIAEDLRISQSTVSDIRKRAIEELKYYLTNRKDMLDLFEIDSKIINST